MYQCPKCKKNIDINNVLTNCEISRCCFIDKKVEFVSEQPILVDFNNSILQREFVFKSAAQSLIDRPTSPVRKFFRDFIYWKGIKVSQNALKDFSNEVKLLTPIKKPKILIVGGATVGLGCDEIIQDQELQFISFDIYASSKTNFVADAHSIPLENECIDGVIIQSVLEHVINPQLVVDEIFRVLKYGGVVYSDTPFLQQVHEGPYDFTRFTNSGHRWLFRNFTLINTGPVFGPSITYIWGIKYFIEAIIRNKKIATYLSLLFFWLTLLDLIIGPKYAEKMSSSFYFLGKKDKSSITLKEIVDFYKGN